MSKVLVTCRDNWADEMDLDGFAIFDSEEWEAKKNKLKEWFRPKEESDKAKEEAAKKQGSYYYNRGEHLSICVGTNEEVYWGSYKDWSNSFKEKKITDEEAETIKKLFEFTETRNEFGFFLYPDDYTLEGESEDDE